MSRRISLMTRAHGNLPTPIRLPPPAFIVPMHPELNHTQLEQDTALRSDQEDTSGGAWTWACSGPPHPCPLPKEREHRSQPLPTRKASTQHHDGDNSPSPRGEGRGEGDRDVRTPLRELS